MPVETITLELYPTPYGNDITIQGLAWEQHRHFVDDLQKQGYQVKGMYTAVRGPDCFYQVESVEDLHLFKMEIERFPLVKQVEIAPVTIKTLPEPNTYAPGLRVHFPLPEARPRRRRW